ncbi:MAG TPA: enoyl-CoA hydratase-related protein [Dehalococcoidia bacterium]|nr:enoyl-CoA hydratase-related protein [Dehalococcoidia bacterium]
MALIYEKRNHIAYLTLNRPESMNALDPQTNEELADAWADFRDDPEAWVAIITGAGDRAFCAGADLKATALHTPQAQAAPPSFAQMFFSTPRPSLMRGLELAKPVICAVNGYALGGGMEMMLACDIRIAAEHATFGLTEARIGSIPGGGGTQRLPRQIPYALAMYMLLTAERITAEEALRFGLINKVVPLDKLMEEAEAVAEKIAANAPLSVRGIKTAVQRGLDVPLQHGLLIEQQIFGMLFNSEDRIEGRRAFAEKRPPHYKGR